MKIKCSKRGLEFSFNWIFSIIVGAVILFLAIYATVRLIESSRYEQDTTVAQELETALYPLATSIESGSKPGTLKFTSMTRIAVSCSSEEPLGVEEIRVAQQSGVGTKWSDFGVPQKSSTQYVFAPRLLEGKEFNLMVKPIILPYKIGDAITLWTGTYCFVQAPREIAEEIKSLGLEKRGLISVDTIALCPTESTNVCFGGIASGGRCDISVDSSNKRVTKKSESVYYEEGLLYSAIISDSALYECQVTRLLQRSSALAEIYSAKSILIAGRSGNGCSSTLQTDLQAYRPAAKGNSRALSSVRQQAQSISTKNTNLICALWQERME